MGNLGLLEDACASLPHTTRAMFGGHGLFAPNGGMFAGIVDEDRIVLKFRSGSPDHEAFIALGARPWTYGDGPKPMTMKEWLLVPDALYDEPRALAEWAGRAHRAAPAKRPKKSPKKARRR